MLPLLPLSDSHSSKDIELGHRLDAIAIGTTTVMRNGIYDRINYSQVPSFFVYFGWQRSTLPPLYGISSVSNTPGTSGSTIGGASPLPNERDCPDLFCLLSYFARQNTWAAMTRFAASAPFNVFLYEGIETIFTVLIVIIVQVHFSRIVRAFLTDKKRWDICSAISCSITFMAGLTTSSTILSNLSHGRLERDTPSRLSVQLTICWAVWLSSATVFDITLLSFLAKHILKQRAGTVQVSFKSLLSRILLVAVYAFLMTSLTSIIAIILIVGRESLTSQIQSAFIYKISLINFWIYLVSTISAPDNFILLSRLRIAAFVSNSFLPRIYLMAFCQRNSSLVGKRKAMDSKSIRYSMPGPTEWA
ncbi:hypothetical protein VP01_3479g1 [Puccinia sorghi]|uniref:Uncharacterized protein n=1 Tax=Puccinia sorghi TaxID=27349 RepID=A0A0L6UVZ1_9BASI|nr:hypothetical protein VP01_3479g1 [Puccinia sorghi]